MNGDILTERLRLRPLLLCDAEPTLRIMTPGIARWTGSWRNQETVELITGRIAKHHILDAECLSFDRAITLKATGALIGWIGARRSDDNPRRANFGYWIGEAYFGQGYTREAARAMIPAAFEALDLEVIEAGAQVANAASIAILRGLGMRHVGQRESYSVARGAADLCDWFELERPV